MIDTLYGAFHRTRTFSEIFPDAATFKNEYNLGIPSDYTITTLQAEFLYYLLLGRYANSHIAPSDENRFKLRLAQIIMQYGPTWIKKLDIQKELRALDFDDFQDGSLQIANHAFNPSTAPSTDSSGIIDKIDQQNTVRYKKSMADAYSDLLMLLDNDVTNAFLSKFKDLFIKFVEPESPLFYESEVYF